MANPENTSGTNRNVGSSSTTDTTTDNNNNNIYSTIRYNRINRTFNVQGQSIPASDFLTRIGLNAEDIQNLVSLHTHR